VKLQVIVAHRDLHVKNYKESVDLRENKHLLTPVTRRMSLLYSYLLFTTIRPRSSSTLAAFSSICLLACNKLKIRIKRFELVLENQIKFELFLKLNTETTRNRM
jgi:hypothetical protein